MPAQWVADATAQARVPLIRFPGPGANGGPDSIDPLMERPDVIVESPPRSADAKLQHWLDAEIMQLAPDASGSAHDNLISVIKVCSSPKLLHSIPDCKPAHEVCFRLAASGRPIARMQPTPLCAPGGCLL